MLAETRSDEVPQNWVLGRALKEHQKAEKMGDESRLLDFCFNFISVCL